MATGSEEMLVGLRDIRLPAEAAGGLAADVLASLTVGLVIALLLTPLLRLLTQRRTRTAAPSLRDRIISTRDLDDEARVLALAHLAAEAGVKAEVFPELYRPAPLPDPDRVESDLLERVA